MMEDSMRVEIEDKNLMTRGLPICENCEWCVMNNDLPKCLLKNMQTGLFEYCNLYKTRTGLHISM